MKKYIYGIIVLLILFGVSACGKKQTYVVTFDSLGGTPVESQSVELGKCVTKPQDPVKEGFTFVDWQYENKTYDFSTPIKNDILLTAFYTINDGTVVISVAFISDNDEEVKTVSIAKGSAISEPPIPQKQGYTFLGWYLDDSKFDFSTVLNENIVLVAKWEVDNSNHKDTNTTALNKQNSSTTNNNNPANNTASNQNQIINFADIEGLWYAEGHDDATLTFSVYNSTWVYLESKGFDHTTCTLKPNIGKGGTEYYYNNGKFSSDHIFLESPKKLIYTKNNTSVVFYREKNYPTEILWEYEKLLKEIDGYYWYLDGYNYTYIHPTIEPWYDHEALTWESENINITNNTLVAFENYELEAYNKASDSASSNTHNALLVNPTKFADSLIKDYGMSVQGNTLTMTVGGKSYTFTKEAAKRDVKITLNTSTSHLTKTVGESFEIEVTATPFWACHSISVTATNGSLLYPSSDCIGAEDGHYKINFRAVDTGDTKIIIQNSSGTSSKTIDLKVVDPPPISVSGVQLNKTNLELTERNSETLVATVTPSNAANKTVIWSSSDTSVAEVSSTGKVTAKGKGSATITVKTADGGFSEQCRVVVKESPLSVSASVGVGFYSSDSSMVRGVFAEVNPTGGSGTYVEYSIKLYYNGTLIAENNKNELIVTPIKNGTYKAEVYVKDSSGNEASGIKEITISY